MHTYRSHASFIDICGAWVVAGSGFGIGFSPRTHFSSFRHPPFTHYPFPPRCLVCGGQPSPHKPRLVVSHSTCPPLSSSPHAHSFVIGPAVINTHTGRSMPRHGWAPDPPMVVIRSPIGLVVGSCSDQPPWSFGFYSQTRGTRENRRTLC
jgi:hypothetical protein